jgi:hypothetical protein
MDVDEDLDNFFPDNLSEKTYNSESINSDHIPLEKYFFKYEWNEMTYKYRYDSYLKKTIKKFKEIVDSEYGLNSKEAWNDILKELRNNKHTNNDQAGSFQNECKGVIEAFHLARHTKVKIQILSLIPSYYTTNTILDFLPTTVYQIKKARSNLKDYGIGQIAPKNKIFRNRIDQSSIDCFLNFITSEDYLQDVAYGDRIIKLENKSLESKLIVPNVVRLATRTTIIQEYHEMCKKENIKALSETTCLKILNSCPASYRKCLQGLDYVMADGLSGFSKLIDLVNEYVIDNQIKKIF